MEGMAEKQIAGAVDHLHGVVLTTTVGMVFSRATLPCLFHLRFGQSAGEGEMQALPRHDCIKIRMLAQRAPVGLAERWTALVADLAFSALRGPIAAEASGCLACPVRPLCLGFAPGGGEQNGLLIERGLGHGRSRFASACCSVVLAQHIIGLLVAPPQRRDLIGSRVDPLRNSAIRASRAAWFRSRRVIA